jgi:hypothetical protein
VSAFSINACMNCIDSTVSSGQAEANRLFAVRNLEGKDNPEAGRATQRAAKLLHEGRMEEALR